MFKGIIWLGRTVAAALIISFLSIWTTGYIVNSYVESLLKQYNIPIEMQPAAVSGVWGKLWGADSDKTIETVKENETAGKDSGQMNNSNGAGQKEDTDDGSSLQEQPPLTGIGVGGGTKANSGSNSQNEGDLEGSSSEKDPEVALTTEEMTGIKGEMSSEDKDQLFAILMAKLPQQSWQEISEYVEEGLTEQELTAVQQILAQHLDKEEYEQMMLILKKY